MKAVLAMTAMVLVLSACGGGNRVDRFAGGPAVPFATGPIQKACQQSDRKKATRSLCGCIQSVADRELSGSDQRLAVKFFKDPHHAQEIRQSDRASHEVFWKKYKGFVASAERQCQSA